jgi:hypothetical protein
VSPKEKTNSLFGLALLYRWKEMKKPEQNANLVQLEREGLQDAKNSRETTSGRARDASQRTTSRERVAAAQREWQTEEIEKHNWFSIWTLNPT